MSCSRSSSNHNKDHPHSSNIIATRTPTQNHRKVARHEDKFEFDAPQFEDFTQPRYLLQKRLLEKVVLPARQQTDWTVEPLEHVGEPEESSSDDDEWFQFSHKEHEHSSPISPAGPLISPLQPSKFSSPLVERTLLTATSPKRSNLGLRSRPMRVRMDGATDTSRGSSTGSLPSFYSEMVEIKSPTCSRRTEGANRWKVAFALQAPRSSTSIENSIVDNELIERTDLEMSKEPCSTYSSSLPISTNWSSIPETPPILASNLLLQEQNNDKRKRSLPKEDTSCTIANLASVPVRRIGLASRALRVPAHEVISNEPKHESGSPLSKPASPIIKRVKVDAKFCPAPPPRSKNPSPIKPPLMTKYSLKKDKPVRLDDLKKLLAEHNQRLRPKNITSRR